MPTSNIEQSLAQQVDTFVSRNPKSRAAIADSVDVLPSGTSRAVLVHQPFPLVLQGGSGCHVTSLDGDEYLDFVSEYCAGMFGHSHPELIKAIESVTQTGFMLGGATRKEHELARLLVSRFPSMDAVRFCNSGTEANTLALATALAYTGRKKILVFENGYHGGTLAFAHANPLILPHDFAYGIYNDIERTRPHLTPEIGAIIVEPMQGAGGMIPGTKAFLQFLRDEASRIGAVLIFDEVITSRLYYGGLQEHHGIIPDMTTIGKHFGGGFSFGAFGGKSSIMALFDPSSDRYLMHSGTFNNNVFSMTAGVVAAKLLSREALEELNRLGDALRDGLAEIFEGKRPGAAIATGIGSAIGLHFPGPEGQKLRELYYFYLLNNGVYSGHRGSLVLNLMHRREHVERVLDVTRRFCEEFL